MSLNREEELELERLLLMIDHWETIANSPMPALNAPPLSGGAAQSDEKSGKPVGGETKPKPAESAEPPRHFIDRICGPGSDRPSGKAHSKHDWML
jgi:hypothetical protein